MADIPDPMQPQLIEDEISELKRKLEDAQARLNAVSGTHSRAPQSEPTISDNGLVFPTRKSL